MQKKLLLTGVRSKAECKKSFVRQRKILNNVLMPATHILRRNFLVRIFIHLSVVNPILISTTSVRVIKGPVWEGRLLKFAGLFTKRRSEFEFSLTIHTSLGVDAANVTLSIVDKSTQEMNAKMDLMMKMFQTFAMPDEKEMAMRIQQKGGIEACEGNDKILKELQESEPKKGVVVTTSHSSKKVSSASDFEDLKDELRVDPDIAMEKNMAVYSRKFEVQKRQIVEELSRVMRHEGDRIISAVTSGPHDHILDPVSEVDAIIITLFYLLENGSNRTFTTFGRKWCALS